MMTAFDPADVAWGSLPKWVYRNRAHCLAAGICVHGSHCDTAARQIARRLQGDQAELKAYGEQAKLAGITPE